MSKKNKNKNKEVDYFDMTPEEQMANAEIFNDVVNGDASILDALNLKVSSGPVSQSDLKRQIAEACFGIKVEDEHVEYEKSVSIAMSYENNSDDTDSGNMEDVDVVEDINDQVTTVVEEVITHTETKTTTDVVKNETVETQSDNVPRIHFRYEPIIGKMLIDDGLVSTPVSIIQGSSIELNFDMIPENTDADEFGMMLSKIFYFIITCKHPAVIMSEETFEIEFGMFSKINFNRFVFFKNAGYVYVYVLDDGEVENFYSVSETLNMDDMSVLRYAVSAAYAAYTIHNIFMYDDEDEVDSVMNARHCVKDLMTLIESDSATEYAGHNASGNVMNRMKVKDLQKFVTDVRRMLDDLISVDEDEDDDESEEYTDTDDEIEDDDDSDDVYEDDDSDDDDVDVNDFPDIDDLTTDTDDIDQMMEEIESSESIVSNVETTVNHKVTTTTTSDESDNMVLPIIRRRQ